MTDLSATAKNNEERTAWWGRLLVLFGAFWITTVVWNAQIAAWLVVTSALGSDLSPWMWATLTQLLLTAVPLIPLALKWPGSRYRTIFQTWLAACLVPLLLAPTRLIPPAQAQWGLISQLLALFVLLLLLRRFGGKLSARELQPVWWTAMWLVLLVVALTGWPWLIWGALGSPLDTLLTLILGLLFGFLIAHINRLFWLKSVAAIPASSGWDLATGGLVLGTAVLLMASGLGINGVQLLLMFVLPALGWAMMGIALAGRRPRRALNPLPAGLLVGVMVALILGTTDSDGLAFGLFDGLLRWSFQAAFVSALLALLAGCLLFLLRRRLVNIDHSRLLWPALAITAVGLAAALYLAAGTPGFYGDHLFVVLKEQGAVSQAATIENYDERRSYVYDELTTLALENQRPLRNQLDRFGVAYTPYYLVNGLEIRGGFLHALWLNFHPDVADVMPSPVLRPVPGTLGTPTFPAAPPEATPWHLTNIEADRVWRELGVTGAGIVIGLSDSGVQWDHPELQDSYLGSDGAHNGFWLDPWQGTTTPSDLGGHGTATLSNVLGNQVGVAPDANWFACANLVRGLGNAALYLDCLQFMFAPYTQGGDPFSDGRPQRAAHILNNSWGCPPLYEGCTAAVLQPAVRSLRAAGIFVVASAGNDGPACGSIDAPIALYDDVFTVGAVDRQNRLASFSSTGPALLDEQAITKPDILAPGADVITAVPDNSYSTSSGTSFSGPIVTGVVALIWSANPDLIGDIAATEQILQTTAAPFAAADSNNSGPAGCLGQVDSQQVPNNIAGYGIVNAYEAVKMAIALK